MWHKIFKDGCESIGSDPKNRRPVTARDTDHIFCFRELTGELETEYLRFG